MSGFDPNALSDEDLEKALDKGDDFQPPVEGEPEAVPEPEQLEEAVAEEAAPEETPAPEPEEPTEDPEAERLRLLSEEMEARAKHWESVAGRNAGELGYIKQQLRAIQDAQRAASGEYEAAEPDRTAPPPPPQRDGVSEWAVQQAVTQTVNGFEASHADIAEMQGAMVDYITKSGYDMKQVLSMDNPVAAQREIARALEEAYWHTKASVTATRRAELETKREAIQVDAAKNKLKAGVSASASTPPPKPKQKTQNEMTDEEIEAEMLRATGGRW